MRVFNRKNVMADRILLEIMYKNTGSIGKQGLTGLTGKKQSFFNGSMDELILSQPSQKTGKKRAVRGRSVNTMADKAVNLKSYISAAKENNKKLIENAGDEIDDSTKEYMSSWDACHDALKAKYSKLVAEARTHSNPEAFITRKYTDRTSPYYEGGLTDKERSTAFRNELMMLHDGCTSGEYSDSLLRDVQINYFSQEDDELQFRRQLVNAQIGNIFNKAGIGTSQIPEGCSFEVDPYRYHITVKGVDDELRRRMENALNVGENGKNLFYHIKAMASTDYCNSSQITKLSNEKHRLYRDIKHTTGYELDKLTEKNGTYYTDDGQDILDLADKGVEADDDIPGMYKWLEKESIHSSIGHMARIGWKNIPDMTLQIAYKKGELIDVQQNRIFDKNFFENRKREWYSVM